MLAVKLVLGLGNEVSEWFPVRVGLRQGCVMSPWWFNLYIDGDIRHTGATRGSSLVIAAILNFLAGKHPISNEWNLKEFM